MSPSTSRLGEPGRPAGRRIDREPPRANAPALAHERDQRGGPVPARSRARRRHPAVEVGVVPGADRQVEVRCDGDGPGRRSAPPSAPGPSRPYPGGILASRKRCKEEPRLLVVERICHVDADARKPPSVGREGGRAGVPGQANRLSRLAAGRRHDPDRRPRPDVRVESWIGGVGDRTPVGRPGDPLDVRLAPGQLPRSRAPAHRDRPDLVPAVPVADPVPAPVRAPDSSRRHGPALRLGPDDGASRRRRRPRTRAGDPSGDQASSETPCSGTHRTHASPPSSAAHHDRRRSVRLVRERAEERQPPAVGADARRRVADGARGQADRGPWRPERDQVEVRPVRLRVHEALDDDGAATTGQRVVLLQHHLAAQEPRGSNWHAKALEHQVKPTLPAARRDGSVPATVPSGHERSRCRWPPRSTRGCSGGR